MGNEGGPPLPVSCKVEDRVVSVEDVSRVVVEVDGESHGHSQGQGCQSLLVLGVQGGAHGDPQVGNRGHLGTVSKCSDNCAKNTSLKSPLPRTDACP